MGLFIAAVDEALTEKGLGFLVTLIDIAIIFLLAFLLVTGLKKLVRRILRAKSGTMETVRGKRVETAATMAVSLARYGIYFIAGALALSELGFASSIRTLLTAAGIGGVVVGIGAQSLVSDIVSGFFLLFEDQFAVGDYIQAGGVTGTVEAVALRTTTIRGYTGELNVVPNGSIKTLTNYSRTNALAVVDVPVAVQADTQRALALIQEEAEAYYATLGDLAVKPPEIMGVASAQGGQKSLRVVMLVKPLEHWAVQRELLGRALARLEKEGIPLPYERIISGGGGTADD